MEQLVFSGWPKPPDDDAIVGENDFDTLLQQSISEAKAIGIPISENISPHVVVNTRATTRFGCCRKTGDTYIIEISSRLLRAPVFSCRQILVHEILHTCYGCRKHGPRWRSYANQMGGTYGYNISRVDSFDNLGITDKPKPRYVIVCQACGKRFERMRSSNLTIHPGHYRCRCGGKLRLEK